MIHLPNEILLLIFDHLAHAYEQDAEDDVYPSLRVFYNVLPLLKVCRQWHDVFLPKVYYSLVLPFARKQLYLLARSLRENSRLATSVRRLWVDCLRDWGATSDDDEEEEEDESVDAENEELIDDLTTEPFRDILEAAGPARRRWQRAMIEGSGDAWAAICLFLMPNLQSFKIKYLEGPKTWIPLALSLIAGSIENQSKPLQHLEEVIIDARLGYVCIPHSDFLPYFHLPSMRSFCGGAITELDKTAKQKEMLRPTPKSSGITELALNTTHGTAGVTEYITACANLRVFLYEHTRISVNDHYPTWSPGIIYNALTTQKHSLEVLYIGFWGGNPYEKSGSFMNNDRPAWWFRSLQEFTHLRDIAVPLEILLDYKTDKKNPPLPLFEMLPSSVENFYLGEVDDGDLTLIASALCAMLSYRNERFPSLREIDLCFHRISFPKSRNDKWFVKVDAALAAVQEMCVAEGVELRYSHWETRGIRGQSRYVPYFSTLRR